MDDTLTLSNYYLFSAVKLDYKIAEHPLRIFEEMAIIEQAVNNQMYDNNQDKPIKNINIRCRNFASQGSMLPLSKVKTSSDIKLAQNIHNVNSFTLMCGSVNKVL